MQQNNNTNNQINELYEIIIGANNNTETYVQLSK